MNSMRTLAPALAALVFLPVAIPPVAAVAQRQAEAHLWLTTSDKANLLSLQPAALPFSSSAEALPTIEVNDMQQFQPMEGFGFALTGEAPSC